MCMPFLDASFSSEEEALRRERTREASTRMRVSSGMGAAFLPLPGASHLLGLNLRKVTLGIKDSCSSSRLSS